LKLSMLPYQLLSFKAPAGTAITGVGLTPPPEQVKRVAEQVKWLAQLAADVRANKVAEDLPPWRRARLYSYASEAETCLQEGRLWRARTLMENHFLLAIYEMARRTPPYLRDVAAPAAPVSALPPETMQKLLGEQAELAASESVCPSWAGEKVVLATAPVLTLPIEVPVDNLYRVTLGHVAGGEFGPLEIVCASQALAPVNDIRLDVHPAASAFEKSLRLTAGRQTLTIRRVDGSKTALSFLDVAPVYHDISANLWAVIGPFEAATMRPSADQMQKPYAPEPRAAPGNLADGHAWQKLDGDADFVNLVERCGSNGISYAVTHIQVPAARKVRLSYGVDYWAKMWLNGAPVLNLTERSNAPAKGQSTLDVELQAGWNQLLVKVRPGSNGNGFWLAVSDPGDLKFAAWPK
ncbi:MAG: hypothetical protein WCI73_09680, partial [Phycisphaerae bacterium]